MAGAMRKMAVYLGLVEDHSDDTYDEYDEYDAAKRSSRDARSGGRGYDDRYDDRADDRYSSRSVRPIPDTRRCGPSGATRHRRVGPRRPRSQTAGRPTPPPPT